MISLLAAMDQGKGIGRHNRLPWRLPADLKQFRELTMGHHIILGRKTYESIGKPLPGRQMIVITRDQAFHAEGCLICHSIEDAISLARQRGEQEVFVCGGAGIYAQTIGLADKLYLTLVDTKVDADTFFPEFDKTEWDEMEKRVHPADGNNPFSFTLKILKRR